MKKLISGLLGVLMVVAVVAEADAKSRGGGFSSGRSSFSSRSTNSYSKPKAVVSSKPTVRSAPKYSAPRAATTKPVAKQSVVASKPMVKKPVASTTFKRPVASAPVRKVSAPLQRTTVRKTTIIQKNYYGSRYSGYGNRGYNRSYGYGGGYGGSYGGGSGMGGSIIGGALGAFGGMMIYDALNGDNQQEPVADPLAAPADNFVEEGTPVEEQPVESGFGIGQYVLPPDAPLMMSPSFYQ